jgi:hypothetical protein
MGNILRRRKTWPAGGLGLIREEGWGPDDLKKGRRSLYSVAQI